MKVLSPISTLRGMMRPLGISAGEADAGMAAIRRVMIIACLEKVNIMVVMVAVENTYGRSSCRNLCSLGW